MGIRNHKALHLHSSSFATLGPTYIQRTGLWTSNVRRISWTRCLFMRKVWFTMWRYIELSFRQLPYELGWGEGGIGRYTLNGWKYFFPLTASPMASCNLQDPTEHGVSKQAGGEDVRCPGGSTFAAFQAQAVCNRGAFEMSQPCSRARWISCNVCSWATYALSLSFVTLAWLSNGICVLPYIYTTLTLQKPS